MKKTNYVLMLIIFFVSVVGSTVHAQNSSTQKDREMLIRLETKLEGIDARFEQIDLRFAELRQDMNARFEQVDKRFEQVDKRFAELIQIVICIVMAFAAIVAVTISFAIWNRRTMTRPFEDKIEVIEKELAQNRKKLHSLLDALRKAASSDEKLAGVLRSFSLL